MTLRIPKETLRPWTRDLLRAAGLLDSAAETASEVFERASLGTLGHHDISYLPQRLQWLSEGQVNRNAVPRLVREGPSFAIWDGDGGLGEICCVHIVREAVKIARTQGLGYVAVRHSNHFLSASPYVDMAAEQGFFALIFSNTDAGMTVPGGKSRQIGNNPLGYSIETESGHSLSADLSMAYASLGDLNQRVKSGTPVPPWWGVDPSGKSSTDPAALLAGGVHPIAEHKGFALALLVEIMTGILSGGTTLDQVAPGGGLNTHNQAILVFDLESFGGRTELAAKSADLARRARDLGPGLRIPGERRSRESERSRKEGIQVDTTTRDSLADWSRRLGVPIPAIIT